MKPNEPEEVSIPDEDLEFTNSISATDQESLTGQLSSIGLREGKALRAGRLIFIFGLFCALPLALGVYFYTAGSEEEHFELQYEQYANKVLEAIGSTLENSFGALDNLAVAFVASVRAKNQTWPYVRIDDFSLRAAKTLSLSRAKVIVTCPLVTDEIYEPWVNWTNKEGVAWVDEALAIQETDTNFYGPIVTEYTTLDFIYSEQGPVPREKGRRYLPSWQAYPIIPTYPPFNFDYIFGLDYSRAHTDALDSNKIVITNPYMNPDPKNQAEVVAAESHSAWLSARIHPDEEPLEPASDIYFPIRDNIESVISDPAAYPPVGVFAVTFYWRDFIRDILPSSAQGILIVVENPCSSAFTYRLDGSTTTLLGRGDHHDKKYDIMEKQSLIGELGAYRIRDSAYTGPSLDKQHCPITFKIYPSEDTEYATKTNGPFVYSCATLLICLFSAVLFLCYDRYQERRQKKLMENAQKNQAIVSSIFPKFVRDKLVRARSDIKDATQIAELYTDTTVFFADIAGFTAWASAREASDVFTLLESIYLAFDTIARKFQVFKVETVGDSYVAVCGLPTPRKDHAVVMARFSAECRRALNNLTKQLAVSLGPGTESLRMRYGLNSGPTTAGVLRGDKTRFQLFGDTANTAARMESTGTPNKIQGSKKTADLLIEAGKRSWLTKREELVQAKGKGAMETFWIEPDEDGLAAASENSSVVPGGLSQRFVIDKTRLHQLIDYHVDVMENLLKDLIAYNVSAGGDSGRTRQRTSLVNPFTAAEMTMPRDEIVEVIPIPPMSAAKKSSKVTPDKIQIPEVVTAQIRSFVESLAYLHNNQNPFHNFEHATHVAMSVRKLLSRILKPLKQSGLAAVTRQAAILQSTYSLTSDPMIQLALYFSALVHDADHPGVSNNTLCDERDSMALMFDNKSCAEQNSIVVAWGLLMSPEYKELRSCMFSDQNQLHRFRQLTINAVMATDVFDKDLKQFRDRRWDKAFSSSSSSSKDDTSFSNNSAAWSSKNTTPTMIVDKEGDLRATIVIEHIIQASDVVHLMQHWTVYQKWNRHLFAEMSAAYRAGRTDKDPADGWYMSELWFFDHYIIPLAKKLKYCGVFGASCDEVLVYAMDNRLEWEEKGKAIIQEWLSQEEEDEEENDDGDNKEGMSVLPAAEEPNFAPSSLSSLEASGLK